MSQTYVSESRVYDYLYDPVFVTPHGRNDCGLVQKQLSQPHEASMVSGTERYKYFKRPVIPQLDTLPAELILAPTADGDPLQPPLQEKEPATKTCGMQTDYRESEAQTDPYTPNFILRKNEPDPELLLLQGLTHDHGLNPVTLLEVQMIEFQRKRHAVEASLPPATDEASMKLRRRILEGLELQAFKIREAEIDRHREVKLETLERLLFERNEAIEYENEQRVEAIRQENLIKRDKGMEFIQKKRLQTLRKLMKERAACSLPGTDKGRDIIKEYNTYCSKVYAPILRDGNVKDTKLMKTPILNVKDPVERLQTLDALAATIPYKLLNVESTSASKAGSEASAGRFRSQDMDKSLEIMDAVLRTKKSNNEAGTPKMEVKKLDSGTTVSKPRRLVERPPTPRVPEPSSEEEIEPYVLELQRLLRGRAIQNMMYEGKERRKDLIEEMKLGESKEENSQANKRLEDIKTTTLDAIAGELVSSMLVNLSGESEVGGKAVEEEKKEDIGAK